MENWNYKLIDASGSNLFQKRLEDEIRYWKKQGFQHFDISNLSSNTIVVDGKVSTVYSVILKYRM